MSEAGYCAAPQISGLTGTRWDFVRAEADRLTKIYTSPPIPVLEIAEQSGVNVVFADFRKHSQTVSGFCDFEAAKLYVNKDDKFGRQMFTMAHELGHWILHKEFFDADPDFYKVLPRFQKPETNPYEQEANLFAAELLAPKKLLLPVLGASVSALAGIFCTSREMMEHRIKNVTVR